MANHSTADVQHALLTFVFRVLQWLNRVLSRIVYRLTPPSVPPLPARGPAILVCNHVSFSDPLVLLATAGRPIRFLMAREIYNRGHVHWVFLAYRSIPVTRGTTDVGAVRAMLAALDEGEVVGLFPEGGIDSHRDESGHLGVGYMAIKTGAPVVPACILWDKPRPRSLIGTLLKPGKALVRYGKPIVTKEDPRPTPQAMQNVTNAVMSAIKDLEQGSV